MRQARPRTALLLVDGPTCPGGVRSAALQELWGESLVARAARQVEALGVSRVIGITGCEAPDVLESFLGGESSRATRMTVPNPDWKLGGCLRALSHAARRWSEPVLLVDAGYAWSDDDIERVCAGQYALTIGVYQPCRRVGVAMFRERAADWFADRAMGESLLGARSRPWQDVLAGSRGGMPMGTLSLEGALEESHTDEDAVAIASW